MTDEQIIKAFEEILKNQNNKLSLIERAVCDDVLSLANRQKAELSALYEIINKQNDEISKLNRKVASRENLEKSFLKTTKEFDKRLEKTVKAERKEAIKEFAERLTTKIMNHVVYKNDCHNFSGNPEYLIRMVTVCDYITDLVKEITEEEK